MGRAPRFQHAASRRRESTIGNTISGQGPKAPARQPLNTSPKTAEDAVATAFARGQNKGTGDEFVRGSSNVRNNARAGSASNERGAPAQNDQIPGVPSKPAK